MSTVSQIVSRPDPVVKDIVYPRLMRYTGGPAKFVVWATGPGLDEEHNFSGYVVAVTVDLNNTRPVGYFSDIWGKSVFEDFTDAVTLFNK